MALSRIKTWAAAEILTASDLNAEFNNILTNALTLINPLTGNLDLDGNEFILDSDADTSISADTDDRVDFKLGGTDIFRLNTVATAVNGIDFFGSATGNQPYLKPLGTDSNFGLDIRDSNGNEIIITDGVASAVNEIKVTNAATTNNPRIDSSGEANTGLIIGDSNGNEIIIAESVASAVNEVTVTNAATGVNPTIQPTGESNTGLILADSNSNQIVILESTASAVNELTITNNSTGNDPSIAATGGDTNINVEITPKGTGVLTLDGSDISTKPAFMVHRNGTSQTNITGTDKVEWTTEEYDTNSDFDSSTNYRFTPTIAGKYFLYAQVSWSSTTASDALLLYIYKNGAEVARYQRLARSSANDFDQVSYIGDANGTTDYFEVFANNNQRDTSSIIGTSSISFFTGCKID